jgi:hypothetical protein
MAWIAAFILAAGLVGCAASGGPPRDSVADESLRASLRASLRPPSPEQTRAPGGGGSDQVTGTLGADSVEGGCAYLQLPEGPRYQVIYPDGWRISASPLELRNPAGDVVATGGDTVTVRGTIAQDMASICQIGPIFRASEVVSIDR